jgi:ABC-type oligopeptide transport system substrate-binding subunit
LFVEPRLPNYLANSIDLCRIEDRADIPQLYPDTTSVLQYLTTYFIGFACGSAPFDNVEARRAFGQSIDRDDLVQQVWSGVQKPATGGIVPPGMPGHSPEIGLAFDPAAARRGLENRLSELGQTLPQLRLAALPGSKTMPEYLRESWQQHLNVSVEIIKDLPIDAILDQLRQGDIHMALIGYDAEYPDPATILRVVFHRAGSLNYFNWQDQEFDRLVDLAATFANKPAQLDLYHQADRLLIIDHVAVVPLFYYQSYLLLRSNFRFAEPSRIIRGGSFRLKYIIQTG